MGKGRIVFHHRPRAQNAATKRLLVFLFGGSTRKANHNGTKHSTSAKEEPRELRANPQHIEEEERKVRIAAQSELPREIQRWEEAAARTGSRVLKESQDSLRAQQLSCWARPELRKSSHEESSRRGLPCSPCLFTCAGTAIRKSKELQRQRLLLPKVPFLSAPTGEVWEQEELEEIPNRKADTNIPDPKHSFPFPGMNAQGFGFQDIQRCSHRCPKFLFWFFFGAALRLPGSVSPVPVEPELVKGGG